MSKKWKILITVLGISCSLIAGIFVGASIGFGMHLLPIFFGQTEFISLKKDMYVYKMIQNNDLTGAKDFLKMSMKGSTYFLADSYRMMDSVHAYQVSLVLKQYDELVAEKSLIK